jgi:Ca2+-transporting ATPase
LASEDSWHTLSVDETLKKLDSSEDGLSDDEVAQRLNRYGSNELGQEERISKLSLLVNQIKNPLIGVLIVAAIISIIVSHYIDAVVIATVIILNAVIGFFQEFKAENALQALKSLSGPETMVLRKCKKPAVCVEQKIKANNLVPGDVIMLEAGSKVPADARIFQSFNLEIDESMLTGESQAVRKKVDVLPKDLSIGDRVNMAFSATIVVQGRGKAIVVATGLKTEIGKIAELIKGTEKVETPIQKQTKDLSKKLGLFALLASALVFTIAVLRGFDFVETFLFALATAVSAIPEGLPAVLTVTLAVGVNRMAKRNALIRKLQAVDTLGSATVICTDKTGTLTTNQMTVRKIFTDDKLISVLGEGYNPEGQFKLEAQIFDVPQNKSASNLLKIAALCNDAKLIETEKDDRIQWEIVGDPTEGALVVAAVKAGLNLEKLQDTYPRIDEIPFDSKERYMVTFHKENDQQVQVFIKGAPEAILPLCTHVVQEDGKEKTLTDRRKQEFFEVSKQMASQALRVLAMAYQTINVDDIEKTMSAFKEKSVNLFFAGFAGMIDPPRSEAKSAVGLCKRAGIRVIMATGDHKLTAEAIAKELGIAGSSGAITGVELDKITDAQLDEIIGNTSVFARVSPTHKFRIVESLRRQGNVVAMTGDGVNDAPALKAAEIGIAMGITGTDVTKETADMVLTDDNFASIVNAVEEGRVIFENIRKVVKYLVSTNTGEIITILSALILLPAAPLIFSAVQILWINLVTDGLLVIPLALEPKGESVMNFPPRQPKERIINREMIFTIIFVGVFMAAGTLWVFAEGLNGNFARAQTLAFVTIALFQVFNSLNCRSRRLSVFKIGIFSNKWLLLGIVFSVTLQVLVTELSFFQAAFGTISLSLMDWVLVVLVSSSVFIGDEIRKQLRKMLK